MIRRLGVNLRAAYAAALGLGGVAWATPQIALVGGFLLIYGLSLLTVFGAVAAEAVPIVLAVGLGFLGLLAGIALAWRPLQRSAQADAPGWDRTVIVASGLVIAGTIAMALYLTAMGVIPILMSSAEQGRVDAAERGGALLRVATLFALPGCWLLVAHATRRRVPVLSVWAIVAVLVTLLGQVATANRSPAFQLASVSIGIVLLSTGRDRLRPRAIMGLAGVGAALILALGMLGAVRLASDLPPGTTPRYADLTVKAILAYVRVPVRNLGYTLEAIPERIGWRLGYTYVQPLLTALPGKQTTFDADLKQALEQDYPGGGTVPGMLGEAYANFGPPGWFLVPLALAAWLTRLRRTLDAAGTPELRAFYAYAIVHAVGGFVGGLHVASPFPTVAYLVLGAASIASLRRERTADGSGAIAVTAPADDSARPAAAPGSPHRSLD